MRVNCICARYLLPVDILDFGGRAGSRARQSIGTRQEAIAAIVKIGKPAAAALPWLREIRDTCSGDSEMEKSMRLNAESAIRALSLR
jgi:hypothetical protein